MEKVACVICEEVFDACDIVGPGEPRCLGCTASDTIGNRVLRRRLKTLEQIVGKMERQVIGITAPVVIEQTNIEKL